MGFEPTETCASHAFQACRFGRSRTPPGTQGGRLSAGITDGTSGRPLASGEVGVGSESEVSSLDQIRLSTADHLAATSVSNSDAITSVLCLV